MIDIIIVNYNSTDYLIRCLKSVQENLNGVCAAVFVQDNASTDGVDRIRDRFPHVHLTVNSDNLGFAKAVNQALVQGTGEYIVLLNPDAYVTEHFFKAAAAFMRENSTVGIMGPRILDYDGKIQHSARSFPTPLTALFGRSSFLSRIFPKNSVTSKNLLSLQSDGKTPMPVDWVSGACMIIRRKAADAVGFLDERFFMYWEDADWCRRMWQGGWRVIYFPQISVYHHVGGSSRKKFFSSAVEFHKSVYRLFDKYSPPSLCFLKPLVIGGLAIRLCGVAGLHLVSMVNDSVIPILKKSLIQIPFSTTILADVIKIHRMIRSTHSSTKANVRIVPDPIDYDG